MPWSEFVMILWLSIDDAEVKEMDIFWTDTQLIAELLADLYPEIDPQYVRFTDLMAKVAALEGFSDDASRCNERILEAIQMAWIEEAR